MRTRRSARNQERLWRYLGGNTATLPARQAPTLEEQLRALEGRIADPFTSPRDKRAAAREADKVRARIKVRAKLQGGEAC